MLARDSEGIDVADGKLAAVVDANKNHYLRRVWQSGDRLVLTADNPEADLAPALVRRSEAAAHRLVGVLYVPSTRPVLGRSRTVREWNPRMDFNPDLISRACGIAIRGSSLAPLAQHGQTLLVGPPLDDPTAVVSGDLLVVETEDDRVGNVVKRVYLRDDTWVLTSPNVLEPREPLVVAAAAIRTARPVIGVLFESMEE